VDTLVEGVTAELGGREDSVRAARDKALREVLETKARHGLSADPAAPR
jgi:hypothetical protein